ncbi:MAG: 50S ribosomal protein L10, partial [Pirellulaceae bacterium]|nr:50S ribosomal protein L10 [Pirellulaceae bacterium]
MSKFVKELITQQLTKDFDGVEECVLVDVVGLDVNETVILRAQLHEKNIRLRVIKKGMALRATAGTILATALEGVSGSVAVCWGGNDFVSLVKEIVAIDKDKENYEVFATRGGVMDGETLTPESLVEISTWPTREELLAAIVGQLLGPGQTLAGQLSGPGSTLASQLGEIEGA